MHATVLFYKNFENILGMGRDKAVTVAMLTSNGRRHGNRWLRVAEFCGMR